MSIEVKLRCEECDHEVDESEVVCRDCYDKLQEDLDSANEEIEHWKREQNR